MIQLSPKAKSLFVQEISSYYACNKRNFPWRETQEPYKIVVSEIMLQQTQTDRVQVKYEYFIERFPTIEALAHASVAHVIAAWQGLGYNRRALALHLFAQRIVNDYKSQIPNNPQELEEFRGIGPATAASICAFAFNKATVFIETNVRAVFIHHFFSGQSQIKDSQIFPLVEQTLDTKNPREWYYALMDYGVMLKKNHKNPSRKSAHHTMQSKFEGSDRQVRGRIIKMLVEVPRIGLPVFLEHIPRDSKKIIRILTDLEQEGFIRMHDDLYMLARD